MKKKKEGGTTGIYEIILCDPPWRFRNWSSSEQAKRGEHWGRANGRSPYDCLNTDTICALPVQSFAARDCCLFLWTTAPKLDDGMRVMREWGFRYTTIAFVWAKQNPCGIGFRMGLGYWSRSSIELCLLGTRGHPKREDRSVMQLVVDSVRDHSRKPDEVRRRIVRLCGDKRRIELFAREQVDGWDAIGDAITGNDIRVDLERMGSGIEQKTGI